ncbi:hypothetical protein NDU88_006361 [Pleurodeles waltl]|uniref:Uncharacterized protein n=1 Tax=Pleurodeles waltl TaxID=8319 RepID=A0AAV7TYA3_PLEWA|nr:hypothetical protein NDU88_006361 [Pleurodeles waltl]
MKECVEFSAGEEVPPGHFAEQGHWDRRGGTTVERKPPGKCGNDGGISPVSDGKRQAAGEEEDGGTELTENKKSESEEDGRTAACGGGRSQDEDETSVTRGEGKSVEVGGTEDPYD